jgi:hypothetical protein
MMDEASPRSITARVMATASLLRGGLARAARAAGLRVVSDDGEPAITLRGVEQRPAVASVDVAVGERLVTITVQGVPDLESARGPQHGGEAWSIVKALMVLPRQARVIWRRPDCLKPRSTRSPKL